MIAVTMTVGLTVMCRVCDKPYSKWDIADDAHEMDDGRQPQQILSDIGMVFAQSIADGNHRACIEQTAQDFGRKVLGTELMIVHVSLVGLGIGQDEDFEGGRCMTVQHNEAWWGEYNDAIRLLDPTNKLVVVDEVSGKKVGFPT